MSPFARRARSGIVMVATGKSWKVLLTGTFVPPKRRRPSPGVKPWVSVTVAKRLHVPLPGPFAKVLGVGAPTGMRTPAPSLRLLERRVLGDVVVDHVSLAGLLLDEDQNAAADRFRNALRE